MLNIGILCRLIPLIGRRQQTGVCLTIGRAGRSIEGSVASADQMQLYLRALELREKYKNWEMYANIADRLLTLGEQALYAYLDYKYGRLGRNASIPIPFSLRSSRERDFPVFSNPMLEFYDNKL